VAQLGRPLTHLRAQPCQLPRPAWPPGQPPCATWPAFLPATQSAGYAFGMAATTSGTLSIRDRPDATASIGLPEVR
jgi:hypothetical protein